MYFEPDITWEVKQVNSLEEYVERFVVKGKFHDKVPTDIKEAWLTVEYLLAHAYYYWPMYDEGFKKALLIIEMAIKLKAKELKNPIEIPQKKGKSRNRHLADIINEVFAGEHHQTLKRNINRARTLRNWQMHPSGNSVMGGMKSITDNLMLFANVLNAVYQEESWHIRQYEIEKKLSSFFESLLVLEDNHPGILIHGIIDYRVLDENLIMVCNPILTNIDDVISKPSSASPIALLLTNFKITENEITGKSPNGWDVRLYKTSKEENIQTLEKYVQQIEKCDAKDKLIYFQVLKQEIAWELVELEYKNLETTA